MFRGLVHRWRLLSARDGVERCSIARATLPLCAYRLGLRLLPFRWLGRLALATTPLTKTSAEEAREALNGISRAVSDAAVLLKGTSTCLAQALAVVHLARREGIDAELCIGVRREASGDFESELQGHAWVELEGEIVHGDNEQTYQRFSSLEPLLGKN